MQDKRDRWVAAGAFFVLLFILITLVGIRIVGTAQREGTRPSEMNDAENAETVEARVVRVVQPDPSQPVQRLELEVVSGPLRGERAKVEQDMGEPVPNDMQYREGDYVLVNIATRPDGGRAMNISDYVRTSGLALLSALFIGFTVLVSGWKGVRSLIGLAISFVVLMGFVLPSILAGRDPVLVSVTGAFALLAVTLYLSLGWSLKTHTALLGVLLSLILIALLTTFAVAVTRLNGLGSEDAMMVQVAGTSINLRGLLLAGMIIGTLGVLDDVVVTQTSTVMELATVGPSVGWRELYQRAMNIGHDHIAATVNTLVLAYVGAAMPMLLLFQLYPEPWSITISRGFVAEEIVRALVGSLGLVAAVPITTITASLVCEWQSLRTATPLFPPESIP